VKYKQRFRHAVRSPAAFLVTHHRRSAYYARHITTRRCQQNMFRWYRVEMRKALWAAWMWRLEQEDRGIG